MLKALLSVRLAAIRYGLTASMRKRRSVSKGGMIAFGLLMVYACGCIGFLFYAMFSMLVEPFHDAGLSWLYFAMFALIDFALMFIGSVFTAKAQLFEAKDNETLLSMPIPPRSILVSRMAALLVINLALELITAIPVAIAWLTQYPATVAGGVAFGALLLALPLFSLSISSLFGWVLSMLGRRMKNKTLASVAFSVVFLAVYFWGYSKMNTAVTALAANGQAVADTLGAVAPVYWIGSAIGNGNWLHLGLALACLVAPFLLTFAVLARTFLSVATAGQAVARTEYRGGEQKVSGVRYALFLREWRRFLSSSAYILNSGLGAIMMVVGAVLLAVKWDAVIAVLGQIPMLQDYLTPVLILAALMLESMIIMSAPSVSLEGKNIWIAQSLPIRPIDALIAKIELHLAVAVPATVVFQVVAAVLIRPNPVAAVGLIVVPLAFDVFCALLGLMANLRHPNLDWINETQAVKSGMSVMIAMLVGWAAVLAPGAGMYFLMDKIDLDVLMLLYAAVLIGLSCLMWRWIRGKGSRIYAEL